MAMRTLAALCLAAALGAQEDLLLHWAFEEPAGRLVADAGGGGRTGAIFGSERRGPGRVGQACWFDGATAVMGRLDDRILSLGAEDRPFALMAWVKSEPVSGAWPRGEHRVVLARPGFDSGLTARPDGDAIRYRFVLCQEDGGTRAIETPALADPTRWYHLAGVYRERAMELYLDGQPVARTAFAARFRDQARVLAAGSAGARSFRGALDEVRVYAGALDGAAVRRAMADAAVRPAALPEPPPARPWTTLAPDRAGLERPLLAGKPVVAHHMTQIGGIGNVRWCTDPDLYRPDGAAASLGGGAQYRALLPDRYAGLDADAVVEFEIRAAQRLGIDAFHFYYKMWEPGPAGEVAAHENNRVVRRFLAVAERLGTGFRVTLCLSQPAGPWPAREKAEMWAARIGDLLEGTRASPAWLRSPDGALVLFTWAPEGLSDGAGSTAELFRSEDVRDELRRLAEGYEHLRAGLGLDARFILHINASDHLRHACQGSRISDPEARFREYVEAALDYFPAVTGFIDLASPREAADWQRWIERCRARGRTYGQAVFNDFYTSKMFQREGRRQLHGVEAMRSARLDELEKYYIPLRGAELFRTLWERGIAADAGFASYVTWNDYPEGHHLAPEITHNYAFAVLLQHYKRRWRGGGDLPERDVAMAFYRKYPSTAEPAPFAFRLRTMDWVVPPDTRAAMEARQDVIEVVTLLTAPGEVLLNGRLLGTAPAGLGVLAAPMAPGPVRVQVRRDGAVAVAVDPPEWITEHPYRTDRLIYAYSSACAAIHRELFGAPPALVSDDYAEDAGVPRWRTRYRLGGSATAAARAP